MVVTRPYNEEKENGYIIRTFTENVDESELVWHRDSEHRLVEVIGITDWKFQFDNELPIEFSSKIFIPKNTYHRVIKGVGELRVKIYINPTEKI